MAIPSYGITSLPDYVNQVVKIRNRWHEEDIERAKKCEDDEATAPPQLWFRGQVNGKWELRPKLYRTGKDYDEDEIRTEFKLRGVQLIGEPRVPKDDREWYFLMQHYGAPTRLLDWTDGALIGLYFAVKSQTRGRDAAVWMLDPVWLNQKVLTQIDENNYVSGILLPHWKEAEAWFPEPFEQALHVTYPVAIDPPHVARRVSVQRSRFTVHGRSKSGLDVLARQMPNARLVKFSIPINLTKTILKDLATCGIVETSVFPDLEGLSRELETKWAQFGFGEQKPRKNVKAGKT
jgi:hypothetical protein